MSLQSPRFSHAESLLTLLRDFVHESHLALPPGDLDLDTRLDADLGLDSLSRAELIARCEQHFGLALGEQALLAPSVRDLLGLIERGRGGAEARAGTIPAAHLSPAQPAASGWPETARTLNEVLEWHCQQHGERVHLLFQEGDAEPQPLRYAELADGARRMAARLRAAGLNSGERVALMLPSGPGYFFSFFGVLLAGGVAVPIYPPARLQLIEDHLRRHARILDNAGCVLLITDEAARSVSRLLRLHVPALRAVLNPDELERETPLAESVALTPGDLALLQYTSGSTGQPKGVMLTHADLLANIRAMGEAVAIGPEDVFVSWLPLYHDMGLIGAWLGSLYFATPLVCCSPLTFLARPARWLEAISRHRGTLSAAPNFAYELCLSRVSDAQLAQLDLSSWRRAFNGAEPVSATTLERFAERFAACGLRREALAPVYGLAEAAVGLAFPPPERGPRIDCVDRDRLARSGYALPLACDDALARRVVACGQPLPGYRVRVVDEQGQERPERHEGVLEFQGPSATRGYFHNAPATAALIRNGWHATGDRAYLAGGDIHLTGRVKDLIIRGGRNLYPYELEQAVGELRGVRQGCVVAFAALDAARGSERLVIVAETKERDAERRAALTATIRARATEVLGSPPDEVVLAAPRAVLKTSSGKLRRQDTRARYLAGQLQHQSTPPGRQLLHVALAGLVRRARAVPGQLYVGYARALFGLFAVPLWLGAMLIPRLSMRWALMRGGVRLLRGLCGMSLKVEGREHVPASDSPWILLANHASYLDALVLAEAIGRPLAFVAKRELGRRGLMRRALERLGTCFVERFDVRQGSADLEQLHAVLAQGAPLVIFPEGTFREQPGLLAFRMGAFVLASRAGVPVVAVTLIGTRERMAGDQFRPSPGAMRVVIDAALTPVGDDWSSATALREAVRQRIASRLDGSTWR